MAECLDLGRAMKHCIGDGPDPLCSPGYGLRRLCLLGEAMSYPWPKYAQAEWPPECLYREGSGQKSDWQLARGLSGSCVTQSKYVSRSCFCW